MYTLFQGQHGGSDYLRNGSSSRRSNGYRSSCGSGARSKIELFCSYCQRRFNKSYNLMIHERSHEYNYSGYSSSSTSSTYNNGGGSPSNFQCDICGKGYSKLDYLKEHRSQHSPGSSSSSSSGSYSP